MQDTDISATGTIGYDIPDGDTRHGFQQAMRNGAVDGSRDPDDALYMARFLSHRDKDGDQPHMKMGAALTWVLISGGGPRYALYTDAMVRQAQVSLCVRVLAGHGLRGAWTARSRLTALRYRAAWTARPAS